MWLMSQGAHTLFSLLTLTGALLGLLVSVLFPLRIFVPKRKWDERIGYASLGIVAVLVVIAYLGRFTGIDKVTLLAFAGIPLTLSGSLAFRIRLSRYAGD